MPQPKKNSAYTFTALLATKGAAGGFQANPTLAAGDVKVSIDGGAKANLTTLPVVEPAGSELVKVALTAAEMNGDRIDVVFKDVAGEEWQDAHYPIQPTVKVLDDVGMTVAGFFDVNLKRINDNAGGVAVMDRSLRSIVDGVVAAGATSSVIPTTSLSPAAVGVDQFKGLTMKFDEDTTTTALRGQGTDILGNTAGGILTVTPLTVVPASGDTFTIL